MKDKWPCFVANQSRSTTPQSSQFDFSPLRTSEIENHDPPAESPEEARKLAENVK